MRNKRVDENQADVISDLRDIPGVTIAPGHDDFLLGFRGNTYWIEWKSQNAVKKSGGLKKGAIRKSQHKIKDTWTGQYLIAWDIKQILDLIGIST